MTARLTIAPAAARDLERVRRWLMQPGAGDKAALVLGRIARAVDDLADAPERWPESLDHPGRRERVVEGHTIVYRLRSRSANVAEAEVVVLRVFGPRRHRAIL